MKQKTTLYKLVKWTFYVSVIMAAVGFWFRDDFPAPNERIIDPQVTKEPLQKKVNKESFKLMRSGVVYEVSPLYEYELNGLVVSLNHHDGKFGLHKRAEDHINVADLCVVWGVNAKQVDLNKFDFWNGEFTCNYLTKDSLQAGLFKDNQLSNNHVVAVDELIRDQIADVKVGDQIYLKGWLSEYSNHLGKRGTSITRDDTGNGACETIYIKDFKVLNSMKTSWRTMYSLGLIGALFSSLIWVWGVGSGRFK
ncbi:hypothetical protein [Zooshikella harenae]|uniref:Uncharacterized protein n=1 Tax=Zooshikella harenae TaxID=2827238 RepID=A0ABS5Z9E4_9GAMM|nr:hypothetical protein [Zooshikella harenae]MBU2710609.1 hypothetical protein [Zooshikella harenae]